MITAVICCAALLFTVALALPAPASEKTLAPRFYAGAGGAAVYFQGCNFDKVSACLAKASSPQDWGGIGAGWCCKSSGCPQGCHVAKTAFPWRAKWTRISQQAHAAYLECRRSGQQFHLTSSREACKAIAQYCLLPNTLKGLEDSGVTTSDWKRFGSANQPVVYSAQIVACLARVRDAWAQVSVDNIKAAKNADVSAKMIAFVVKTVNTVAGFAATACNQALPGGGAPCGTLDVLALTMIYMARYADYLPMYSDMETVHMMAFMHGTFEALVTIFNLKIARGQAPQQVLIPAVGGCVTQLTKTGASVLQYLDCRSSKNKCIPAVACRKKMAAIADIATGGTNCLMTVLRLKFDAARKALNGATHAIFKVFIDAHSAMFKIANC